MFIGKKNIYVELTKKWVKFPECRDHEGNPLKIKKPDFMNIAAQIELLDEDAEDIEWPPEESVKSWPSCVRNMDNQSVPWDTVTGVEFYKRDQENEDVVCETCETSAEPISAFDKNPYEERNIRDVINELREEDENVKSHTAERGSIGIDPLTGEMKFTLSDKKNEEMNMDSIETLKLVRNRGSHLLLRSNGLAFPLNGWEADEWTCVDE